MRWGPNETRTHDLLLTVQLTVIHRRHNVCGIYLTFGIFGNEHDWLLFWLWIDGTIFHMATIAWAMQWILRILIYNQTSDFVMGFILIFINILNECLQMQWLKAEITIVLWCLHATKMWRLGSIRIWYLSIWVCRTAFLYRTISMFHLSFLISDMFCN